MTIMIRAIFAVIFATISLLAADSTASQISLRTYLQKEAVPLNNEAVYVVELSWTGDLQRYHITEMSEPVLTNLSLRGSGSSNRFGTDADGRPQSVKQLTYYLTPLEIGMGYVDGIIVSYEDVQSGQTASLSARRLGIKITEPTQEAGTMPGGKILLIIIAGLLAGVVGWFLWRYYMLRNKKDSPQQTELSPGQACRRELAELTRSAGKDLSADFATLDHLLRQFLARELDLAPAADVATLRSAWPQTPPEDLFGKLEQFYQQSELSKFAGEPISEAQFHLFADTVELVINHLESSHIKGE